MPDAPIHSHVDGVAPPLVDEFWVGGVLNTSSSSCTLLTTKGLSKAFRMAKATLWSGTRMPIVFFGLLYSLGT